MKRLIPWFFVTSLVGIGFFVYLALDSEILKILSIFYNKFLIIIDNIMQEHWWYAAIVYILFIAITTNFFFPFSILILSAPALFGNPSGFVISIVGASISIALAPFIFSTPINKVIKLPDKYKKTKDTLNLKRHLSVFLIRLTIIPFAVKNILTMSFQLSFMQYFSLSLLGELPGIIILCYLPTSLMNNNVPALVASLFLFCLLFFINRKYLKNNS